MVPWLTLCARGLTLLPMSGIDPISGEERDDEDFGDGAPIDFDPEAHGGWASEIVDDDPRFAGFGIDGMGPDGE